MRLVCLGDPDHRDIGAQCGDMAAKVLKGASLQTVPLLKHSAR